MHGDFAAIDSDGMWYIRGRSDDTIKVAGKRLGPAEVESVIQELAGVQGVCVFGVPDAQWGEAIRAVVAVRKGAKLAEQAVIDHVGSRIARFKRPKRVFFTDALPRGQDGETDREAVKKQWGAAT